MRPGGRKKSWCLLGPGAEVLSELGVFSACTLRTKSNLPGWIGVDSHWRALLIIFFSREPGSTVMIIGNKADGVLVGMDGRYSSMASGFR